MSTFGLPPLRYSEDQSRRAGSRELALSKNGRSGSGNEVCR